MKKQHSEQLHRQTTLSGTPETYMVSSTDSTGVQPEAKCAVSHLQIKYLRRLHGLSEAQAHMMAILIWGGLQ